MHNHKKIWTVGHSTRMSDDFIGLLQSFKIERLVDASRLSWFLKISTI